MADSLDVIAARVESWTLWVDGAAYTNSRVIEAGREDWYLKVYCGK